MYNAPKTPQNMRALQASHTEPLPTYQPSLAVFHPRTATGFAEDNEIDSHAVIAAGNVIRASGEDWKRLVFARENRSLELTQYSHLKSVKNQYDKTLEKRAKDFSKVEEKLAAELEEIEREKRNLFFEDARYASEVRRHASTLSDSGRMELIDTLLAGKDVQSLAAILNSPPFLSGLDAKGHAWLKSKATETLAPGLLAREKALLKAKEGIKTVFTTMMDEGHALHGGSVWDKLHAQETEIRRLEKEIYEGR